MSDPAQYRTKKELESYKSKDPIEKLKSIIIKKKILNLKKIEEIELDVLKKIKQAAEFAENSPKPKKENLYEDVYAL